MRRRGTLERSQGGLGIGLTLVQRLVESHGGTVKVRSDGLGKGSEFVVRLPIANVQDPEPQRGTRSGEEIAGVSKRRILIVDDNQDSAKSLAMLLRLMGNEVHTAVIRSGCAGLATTQPSPEDQSSDFDTWLTLMLSESPKQTS